MPWNRGGNDVVEDCRSVDIRRWHRDGLLIDRNAPDDGKLTNGFGWHWSDHEGESVASISVTACPAVVWLKYRYRIGGGDWQQVNERICLTHTAMNFGGERVWFLCPSCGRRCAKIYINGEPACRTCKRLTYGCQVERPWEQYNRQARKIEDLIESRGGMVDFGEIHSKPPAMHWSTFNRLVGQHDRYSQASLLAVLKGL